MRLLMYTPTLDVNDRVFAFTRGWVQAFQEASGKDLLLVTRFLRGGDLPERVTGVELGKTWFTRIVRLWHVSFAHRKEYDAVFVHMTPQMMLVGLPVWRLLGKKVFFWYAHGSTPWYLRVALALSDGAFSPNPTSLRLSSDKIHYVGHGIDTHLFHPDARVQREAIFRTIGRVTPKKRIEQTLEILAEFYKRYPELAWQYEVIGPSLGEDVYVKQLQERTHDLGLDERVTYRAQGVPYKELPALYQSCAAFLSTSDTGSMDKAVLEALACGTPVFATGEAYRGMEGVYALQASLETLEGLKNALENVSRGEAPTYSTEHTLERLVKTIYTSMNV